MPSLYESGSGDQNKREQAKRKLAKTRREIVASENAKLEPKLASRTLSIGKQGDNYLFNYSDVILKDKFVTLTTEQNNMLLSLQFAEAVKALWHNIMFVLSIQNFGVPDKNGNLIDMEYIRKLKFDYNTKIRSHYACKTNTSPIQDPNAVKNALISALEKSQQIVADFDIVLGEINKSSPELYNKLSDKIELRTKLLFISGNIITSLENDKINLDKFKNQIYYGKRTSPIINF